MKAFPTDRLGVIKDSRGISINAAQQDGMDLRDYFAAKALQANIPVILQACNATGSTETAEQLQRRIAQISYEMADAMLQAREVNGGFVY